MPEPRNRTPRRRRSRVIGYGGAIVVAVLAAGVLGPFRSASRGAPDLAIGFTEVPGALHAGKSVLVGFQVESLGAQVDGFEARVLLCSTPPGGAPPFLMTTLRAARPGQYSVAAAVPAEPGPGPHYLRLEIDPAPGELVTTNNAVESDLVDVLTFDLEVADPAPIAFAPVSSGDVLTATLEVVNAGSPGGVLVFTVATPPGAPWLTAEPASAFVVAGGPPRQVTVRCDPSLAPPAGGVAAVTVSSFDLPDDQVVVPVTVSVEPPWVDAGWTVLGSVGPGEPDEIRVQGVQGQRVKIDLRVPKSSAAWQPRITFVDPDGAEEATLAWKGTAKKVRRSHKVQRSGGYRLRISGAGGSAGAYELALHRKLPKKARKRTVALTSSSPTAEVRILVGGELDLRLEPGAAFPGPLQLSLVTPDGAAHDLQPFVVPDGGALTITGLPAAQTGSHWITVSGFGAPGAGKVVSRLEPSPPPKAPQVLVLP